MALTASLSPLVARTAALNRATKPSNRWLYFFLLAQFVSQGLLVVEAIGGLRTYLRAAAFLSSIAMLVILRPVAGPHHPVRRVGIAFLLALAVGILQPDAMLLAGFAHWWLNLAIWAPLFWVS